MIPAIDITSPPIRQMIDEGYLRVRFIYDKFIECVGFS